MSDVLSAACSAISQPMLQYTLGRLPLTLTGLNKVRSPPGIIRSTALCLKVAALPLKWVMIQVCSCSGKPRLLGSNGWAFYQHTVPSSASLCMFFVFVHVCCLLSVTERRRCSNALWLRIYSSGWLAARKKKKCMQCWEWVESPFMYLFCVTHGHMWKYLFWCVCSRVFRIWVCFFFLCFF